MEDYEEIKQTIKAKIKEKIKTNLKEQPNKIYGRMAEIVENTANSVVISTPL